MVKKTANWMVIRKEIIYIMMEKKFVSTVISRFTCLVHPFRCIYSYTFFKSKFKAIYGWPKTIQE
ncbi:hypothetical protein ABB05_13155 [Lederbergia galactosidilytica]|uniref:Uncharacterized protein n=1 Tax=Lederbergia galactosidilytica TaxID=217031 RepID=A0A177ZQ75_9BACI|nr:hypothetical protein ABB05_13155 [Lederbergia galactosidilytica]